MKIPKIAFFSDEDEMIAFCDNTKEKLGLNCEVVEDKLSTLQLQGFEDDSTISVGFHVLVYEEIKPDRATIAKLLGIKKEYFIVTIEKPFLGYESDTCFIVNNVDSNSKKEKEDFERHSFEGENGVDDLKFEDCYHIISQENGDMISNIGYANSNFVPKSFCKTEPIII